ncbi:alpha/beta hydrolase family protein [Streptomyces paludis]|uniref:Hydrolase n=1 Tax=Streptomyces paludis TaxID=2282738 RepID=A0A345HSR3_9ACTN|nr:hydrolase [Streptomyces paludis]AXG79737.1 hydrolase [Streptomyces paludis]
MPRSVPDRPSRTALSRRRLVVTGTALAAGAAAGVALGGTAHAATAAAPTATPKAAPPVRLTLPRPSGPYALGTVALHLTDRSRRDPWVPSRPARELMAQVWYPAASTPARGGRPPLAPWMTAGAAAVFQRTGYLLTEFATLPLTHARTGAPADTRAGRRPVLLYSHGHGQYRASSTALVEDLVSHGYVVVTIDHPYDAGQVEFPGGRVAEYAMPDLTGEDDDPVILKAVAVRVADTRFVLEELSRLVRNGPRSGPLPYGLASVLDLSRTGMFGHSLGGATAAQALASGVPVAAGADLDGSVFGPVLTSGLRKPFLLMGEDADTNPSWAAFWPRLRGWRRNLRLTGTRHFSFTDYETFLPQVAGRLGATPEQLAEVIGPLNGARAIDIQRRYLRAFFDLHLRDRRAPLLAGPSRRYPEVRFIG